MTAAPSAWIFEVRELIELRYIRGTAVTSDFPRKIKGDDNSRARTSVSFLFDPQIVNGGALTANGDRDRVYIGRTAGERTP
jgi:hypothetical protein